MVRDHDVATGDRVRDCVAVGRDCRHRAGIAVGSREDGLAACLAEPDEIVLADRTGDAQCRELAVAVARDHVGPHAARREQIRDRKIGDAERRLRDARVGERLGLRGGLVGAERRGREHLAGELRASELEPALEPRECDEQLGEHARLLAALARAQERELADFAAGNEHAALVAAEFTRDHELVAQIVEALGDDRDLDAALARAHRARLDH